MKFEVVHPFPHHRTVESHGATYTGLVVPLVRDRGAAVVVVLAAMFALPVAVVVDDPQAKIIALGVMLTLFAIAATMSVTRGPMQVVLTDDALVQVGAGGSGVLPWDHVTGTSRARRGRIPVLEVHSEQHPTYAGRNVRAADRMSGGRHDFAIPLWALEGSEQNRLEKLIRVCADDPEERRRVASGGPGSRGGWPAASA